jgi:hypothetical protein
MKLRILGVALASSLALIPSTAAAKGVTDATVSGPGLTASLQLGQEGSSRLAAAAGLYAAFSTPAPAPGPLQAEPPPSALGPRYLVTYSFLFPEQPAHPQRSIRQDLYPFASTGPVVHTPPGQHLFDTTSQGGWHPASPALTMILVAAGVPTPASYQPPPPPPPPALDAQPTLTG